MKFMVNYLLPIILFAFFLREAWFTISKYREANTFLRVFGKLLKSINSIYLCVQIKLHDDGHILFPSITFCKNYMYSDDRHLNKLKSGNLSTSQAAELFRELTWSREQMFRTVSHHTMDGTYKRPCNTVGGPRMGSPCSFPFVYPDCSENVKPLVVFKKWKISHFLKSFLTTDYIHCLEAALKVFSYGQQL